jgi:asparagine synthase (glutamine-hydrolysing)
MCGICGVVFADERRHVDPGMLRVMSEAIVHRGPDEEGCHIEGPVGLAARRLSIIDVAGGRQPVRNEDGTLHVVYNGEIYNFRELREKLARRGHSFTTRSDTEVVVHAYEDEGAECLQGLRGMFALALWDASERSLFLAIDRFGIKPLYYAATSGGIVFGSELKCLIRSGLVDRQLDFDALAQYFTFNYIPPPATIYAGIQKLAPGTFLRWTPDGGPVVQQYWELPASASDRTPPSRPLLREVLADAVRSHLVSDVPLGAFLSGGIDSSIVVALMSEATEDRVRTFSIGFSDPRYNELYKARIVARHFGTDHHELVVEPDAVDLLPNLVAQFDEPFADPSALPTYHVSKLARESVKVALSGDGGDELFLGYPLFQSLRLSTYAHRAPAAARRLLTLLPQLVRTPSAEWNDRLSLTAKRATETMLPPDDAYRRKMATTSVSAISPFLSGELRRELEARDPYATVDRWLARYGADRAADTLDRFARTALQVSLAGDMLVKVDRMSMATSLEVRVPLLDHLLAEHVAAISVRQRMPRWRLKGLLKETMADTLPPQILNQPKRGFNVPLAAWFRGDLKDFATQVLTSSDARRHGFLDTEAAERLLRKHFDGSANLGRVIWSLLVFELWCRESLEG